MAQVHTLKKAWWRMPKPIRKSLVLMVGSAIIIAGLFMLVIPGPGWAAIFLGFAVLATEFAAAEKVRDWLVEFVKNLVTYLREIYEKLKNKH